MDQGVWLETGARHNTGREYKQGNAGEAAVTVHKGKRAEFPESAVRNLN